MCVVAYMERLYSAVEIVVECRTNVTNFLYGSYTTTQAYSLHTILVFVHCLDFTAMTGLNQICHVFCRRAFPFFIFGW